MIAIRRGIKKDTLESTIFDAVWTIVSEQIANSTNELNKDSKTLESFIIPAKLILRESWGGVRRTRHNDKQQSFDTPGHGYVALEEINAICEDRFGAKKQAQKQKDGVHLIFELARLNKVKAIYDLTQEGIKIIKEPAETIDKNNHRESDGGGCGGCGGLWESGGIPAENSNYGNQTESMQNVENSQQIPKEDYENSNTGGTEKAKKSPYIVKPPQAPQPPLSESLTNEPKNDTTNDKQFHFIKCPICHKFDNIHQESVDHHVRYAHGGGDSGDGNEDENEVEEEQGEQQ